MTNNTRRKRRGNSASQDTGIYELSLVIGKKTNGKLKLGIDFTFHTIKDVKRLEWSK